MRATFPWSPTHGRSPSSSSPLPDLPQLAQTKLKVVGLTPDVAQSYAPMMTITVSYAGQDGTPKPFLMICQSLRHPPLVQPYS